MSETDLGVWEPFSVATVLDVMAGADVTWWLSGGVALDVFVGRPTRAHGDIDISLCRADLPAFRRRTGTRLEIKIAHGGVLQPLTDRSLADDMHNLWARESHEGPWRLQVNLEPVERSESIYRREPRVRLPLDQVIRTRDALPYVSPAVQLLWKAKDTRPQDEQDFDVVVPLLTEPERRWLADAISRCHPTSPWPDRLSARG